MATYQSPLPPVFLGVEPPSFPVFVEAAEAKLAGNCDGIFEICSVKRFALLEISVCCRESVLFEIQRTVGVLRVEDAEQEWGKDRSF